VPSLSTLPHAAVEPLSILPPWLVVMVLLAIPLLLLLLMALVFWWVWRRMQKLSDAELRQRGNVPKRPRPRGLGERIEAIRRHHLELHLYRDGCHALSGALKSHLERRTGVEVEELTVAELEPRLADSRQGQYFIDLRSCQYGRRQPGRRDFESLCDRARSLFSGASTTVKRGS
jgi:hypothetical protein